MAKELPMPSLTRHASDRSRARRISHVMIDAVLLYGRLRRDRGAEIYTLGWREVRHWGELGIDLARLESIEVVVSNDGWVITAYRKPKPAAIRDRALRHAA
jgi:hypothetical protein